MGKKKDSIREKAQDWYVGNHEATQAEVAELFNVTPKTIGLWAKKYDWESKRLEYQSSPIKIKQLLQQELVSVAQGNPAKLPADGIAKLMAALDRCEKKADVTVVHQILKDLDNFISQIDPHFATKATAYHKQFLQHRINLEA